MTRDTIFTTLRSNMDVVFEKMKNVEVSEEKSLVEDFGASSLEVVEVVSRVMKQLRIKLPRTELSKAKNIGQLVDLLAAHAEASPR